LEKQTKSKRTGGVAQVVEALSSIFRSTKKKKRKGGRARWRERERERNLLGQLVNFD
jgi:uncharacterized protein YjiS (DUF1127 family)